MTNSNIPNIPNQLQFISLSHYYYTWNFKVHNTLCQSHSNNSCFQILVKYSVILTWQEIEQEIEHLWRFIAILLNNGGGIKFVRES